MEKGRKNEKKWRNEEKMKRNGVMNGAVALIDLKNERRNGLKKMVS
jgi:hypothetical protein